jgi:hypothetical protein
MLKIQHAGFLARRYFPSTVLLFQHDGETAGRLARKEVR